jgi:FAD/FMN-containing dehydrogenase
VILWAEIRLKPIPGASISMERIRFSGLSEFFLLSSTDQEYEYTVAWVDCLARGKRLGRGLFLRGDHAPGAPRAPNGLGRTIPGEMPSGLINRATVAGFNAVYYRSQLRSTRRTTVPYEPFFFPLDGIANWNRLYGKRGLLQHQCVIPEPAEESLTSMLHQVAASGEAPSLAVLKRFGTLQSPGMLSFPRPGITLAIDFANRGSSTLALLERLDEVVREAGGAVYPAKDARMSPASFRRFFPGWETFARHVDPKFSSSFWRRVNAG